MGKPKQQTKLLLSPGLRRVAFVDFYCGKAMFNASEAARLCGYKGNAKQLAVRGSELLGEEVVQTGIRERMLAAHTHAVASAQEVLCVLSAQLRGSMDDFTIIEGGEEGAGGHVVLNAVEAKLGKKMGLVKKLRTRKTESVDQDGNVVTVYDDSIELYDVQKAGELLLKARGIIGKDEVRLVDQNGPDLNARKMAIIEKYQAIGRPMESWPVSLREFYRKHCTKQITATVKDVTHAKEG